MTACCLPFAQDKLGCEPKRVGNGGQLRNLSADLKLEILYSKQKNSAEF